MDVLPLGTKKHAVLAEIGGRPLALLDEAGDDGLDPIVLLTEILPKHGLPPKGLKSYGDGIVSIKQFDDKPVRMYFFIDGLLIIVLAGVDAKQEGEQWSETAIESAKETRLAYFKARLTRSLKVYSLDDESIGDDQIVH
ncbi:MAG: hypothetical protein GY719_37020 [bacterium]|nr:hypothetical protein [bacterium]